MKKKERKEESVGKRKKKERKERGNRIVLNREPNLICAIFLGVEFGSYQKLFQEDYQRLFQEGYQKLFQEDYQKLFKRKKDFQKVSKI